MTQDRIFNGLIAKGYEEKCASVLAEDLSKISKELDSTLRSWLESGEELDYVVNEFSIKGLMKTFQLQFPAALLSVDWIIKEPNKAIAVIKKGIK